MQHGSNEATDKNNEAMKYETTKVVTSTSNIHALGRVCGTRTVTVTTEEVVEFNNEHLEFAWAVEKGEKKHGDVLEWGDGVGLWDGACEIQKKIIKQRLEQPEKPEQICVRCGVTTAQEPHPCPYDCDVNNDSDTRCNCCEKCELDCGDDI